MWALEKPGWRLIIGLCLAWSSSAQNLERDRPLQGILKGGESQSYRLSATTGQYFRVMIRPNGCPLSIRLLAPSGAEITTVVNAAGELRDLPVSNIAEETGTYRLEFAFTDPDAPGRTYVINLTEIRTAALDDEKRIAAERTFQAGKRLQAQGSKESLQQAIASFESTLPLWRTIADKTQEGRTFDTVGDTYWSLGEPAKAKECFAQALSLAKASNRSTSVPSARESSCWESRV